MSGKRNKVIIKKKMTDVENGKFVTKTKEFEVVLLCVVEGYAMVRHPRCMPFVVSEKDIVKP